MSCFSSTVMLSLRFLTMSAGDLWDLPKGKGMAERYHEQPGSGLSTLEMKCKKNRRLLRMKANHQNKKDGIFLERECWEKNLALLIIILLVSSQ